MTIAPKTGGNTGDGEIASAVAGRLAETGAYSVTCEAIDITPVTPATPVADARNTGNGAFASVTVGATAKLGAYRLICIEAASDAGVLAVFNPDGAYLGTATVGVESTIGGLTFTIADGSTDFDEGDTFYVEVTGSGGSRWAVTDPHENRIGLAYEGVEFSNDHLTFTIGEHDSTAFAVSDAFTITVAGSGKCVAVDSTRHDGAGVPWAVLAEGVDATGADTVGVAFKTGQFNERSLTFGGSDDADTHREACRALSIFFKSAVSA